MKKKGVHPFDYMDSFTKFDEKIPENDDFYNILQDKNISDEQYNHTKSGTHSI